MIAKLKSINRSQRDYSQPGNINLVVMDVFQQMSQEQISSLVINMINSAHNLNCLFTLFISHCYM